MFLYLALTKTKHSYFKLRLHRTHPPYTIIGVYLKLRFNGESCIYLATLSNEEPQDEPIEHRRNQSGLSVRAEREFWNQLVDAQTAEELEDVTCCHVL